MQKGIFSNYTRRQGRLQAILLFILLSIVQTNGKNGGNSECIEFNNDRSPNQWSSPKTCDTDNCNIPDDFAAAAYQRGPAKAPSWQQDNMWRIVLYGGLMPNAETESMWIYFPAIKSWTSLPLTVRPPLRIGHTMTSWCNTSVILVGGRNSVAYFNDTWLFDGVTETWRQLDVSVVDTNAYMKARVWHSAVAVSQPLSNCTCQESIIVYGGSTESETLRDMWELRCMADSEDKERVYWTNRGPNATSDSLWPEVKGHNVFSSDYFVAIPRDVIMYMRHNGSIILWEYNITSWKWALLDVRDKRISADYIHGVFFFAKIDGLVAISSGTFSAIIVKSSNRLGGYDVINVRNNIVCAEGTSVALDDAILLIHKDSDSSVLLYKMTYLKDRTPYFHWTTTSVSRSKPLFRIHGLWQSAVLEDSLYVFYYHKNGVSTGQFRISSQFWYNTWSMFGPEGLSNATVAAINSALIAIYSPCPFCDTDFFTENSSVEANVKVTSFDIWIYNSRFRRWTLCLHMSNQSQSRLPLARVYTTMTSMENGSLLLYGGLKYIDLDETLNDLWRVDVCHQNDHVYSPVRVDCVRWVLLSDNAFNELYPTARHAHAAYVYNDSLFIFGGIHVSTNSSQRFMLSDMWRYRIKSKQWRKVVQSGSIPGVPCGRTVYSKFGAAPLARLQTKIVVVGNGNASALNRKLLSNCNSPALFSFDVNSNTWMMLADAPLGDLPSQALLTFWNETLLGMALSFGYRPTGLNVDILSPRFRSLVPACPAGHYSKKWKYYTCPRCDVGEYAPAGAVNCSSCPEGLTTVGNNNSKLSDCVCRSDYCNNGKCLKVVLLDDVTTAHCQCDVGYTGTTCQVPTYYLIGAAVVGVALLVAALVLFVGRMTKYRKAKKLVEVELSSAHKVWTIHCDEIELQERIDEDTPGSYGEVYKAMYRDLPVAVKYLSAVMFTDPAIRKEFEREVMVMRGIRHPNIVMFFGAGTVQSEVIENVPRYPFLVVELMARGTLKRILDTPEIAIDYNEQVAFALDAARGMQYLHGLSPPRIHRDVKSCNLLVSHSWVVKVADFGSARAVKREGERQLTHIATSHHQRDDMRTPLVQADCLLTKDTGTILWRSPEVFARERYGTSADVYSFGIVLWEILCRDDPYKDHEFQWIDEVSRAVQSGIRPTIPPFCPPQYVTLVKDCWNTDPDCRPSFTQIVDRLVLMATMTLNENEEATTPV